MKFNITTFLIGLSILTCSTVVTASPKSAVCQIDEGGRQLYKGKCQFEAQGGGSFYISHPSFVQKVGVEGLMVMVERKNQAVVQATRIGGGGSMWGEAIVHELKKHVGLVITSRFVLGKRNLNVIFRRIKWIQKFWH